MISSSDSCRQLVAGNYDVILDDDEIASFKSVLSNFLVRFEHHENELLLYQQQQQQQQQHQPIGATPLLVGSYVEEFKMLKELSRALKENPANYIDGLEAHNQPKNRYKDIIPFNHTRVVLDHVAQLEPGSNYINANYVQGPNGSPRSYIACQGPLPHTLIDFWRMIWECRVSVIVMACNEHEMGRSKCEQYWPKQMNGSSEFGNIRVNFTGERQINSDFLIRKFSIQLLQENHSDEQATESELISNTSPLPAAASNGPNNKVQPTQNQPETTTTLNDDNNNHLDEAINTTISCNEHGHNSRHTNETFSNSGNSSATSNESINTSDYSSGANLNSGQNSSQKQDEDCRRRRHYQPDRCHNEVLDGSKAQTNRTVLAERTVCQFHFQGWQDHGVPDSVESILELIRLIREVQPGYSSSIVVHCSAGCGRTGTICCIDYVYGLMRMGKLTPDFDLFTIISHMRQQRMAMVQTIEQYILCHRAVAALFVQQLQMLEFNPNQNRFMSASQQAAGYNELAAQNQLENGQDVIERCSKNDTSDSTVATDELSGNSKFSIDQSDNDEDQDIGPVFI